MLQYADACFFCVDNIKRCVLFQHSPNRWVSICFLNALWRSFPVSVSLYGATCSFTMTSFDTLMTDSIELRFVVRPLIAVPIRAWWLGVARQFVKRLRSRCLRVNLLVLVKILNEVLIFPKLLQNFLRWMVGIYTAEFLSQKQTPPWSQRLRLQMLVWLSTSVL